MNNNSISTFFMVTIAVIFTVALTFASIELPKLTDDLLQEKVNYVNVYTGGGELQELKTELFIKHFNLRTLGYVTILITLILIIVGFITEKTGLTSFGAIAIFLPIFGHFAATMFFLGGLGFLRLLWLPGIDISFDLMKLGDAVFIPYRIILDLFNLFGINLYSFLPYFFISLGLLIFCYSTIIWFKNYFKEKILIQTSIYKISRHPQYLGWIIWSYGILLLPGVNMKQSYSLSDSLPWLLATFIIIGVAMIEELKMSKKYGEEFINYRKRSYFMFPFPVYFCRVISAPFRVFFNKGYPTKKSEIFIVLTFYFFLIVLLTAVLNYSAKMEAPGRWVFDKPDSRPIEQIVEDFVETPERRDKFTLIQSFIEKGKVSVPYLIQLTKHPGYVIREFSVDALGELKSDNGIDALIAALNDNNWRVVSSAINSLGNYNSVEAVNALIGILDTSQTKLKSNIAGALLRIGTPKAIDKIIPLAENNKIDVSIALIEALSKRGTKRAENLLLRYISNSDLNIRRAAVIYAMNYNSAEIKNALRKAKADADWEVRLFAEEVLNEISGS